MPRAPQPRRAKVTELETCHGGNRSCQIRPVSAKIHRDIEESDGPPTGPLTRSHQSSLVLEQRKVSEVLTLRGARFLAKVQLFLPAIRASRTNALTCLSDSGVILRFPFPGTSGRLVEANSEAVSAAGSIYCRLHAVMCALPGAWPSH